MKGYRVPLKVSSDRTLRAFFYGFGLAVGFLNYALAAIAWIAARQTGHAGTLVGHISLILAGACLSQTYLSWRHFFMMPLLLSLTAAMSFVGAYFLISSGVGPVPSAGAWFQISRRFIAVREHPATPFFEGLILVEPPGYRYY